MDFLRDVWEVVKTYVPTVGLTILEVVAALMLGIAVVRVIMRLVPRTRSAKSTRPIPTSTR